MLDRWDGAKSQNFVITRATLRLRSQEVLTFSGATATFEQSGYPAADSVDARDQSGWAVAGHAGKPCEVTWLLTTPFASKPGQAFQLTLEQKFGGKHLLRGFEVSLLYASPQATTGDHAQRQFGEWLRSQGNKSAYWHLVKPAEARANLARLEPQSDGSYLAIGDITKRDEYTFDLKELPLGTTALMIEALTDPSLPKRGPGRTYYEGPAGDFFLSEVTVAGNEQPLKIKDAVVDFALAGREAEKVLDGDPLTGWSIDGRQGQAHRLVIALINPVSTPSNAVLRLLFERYYAAPMGRVSPVVDHRHQG